MGAAGLTRPLLHRRRKGPAAFQSVRDTARENIEADAAAADGRVFDPELTVVTVRYRKVIPAPSCVLRQICRSLKSATSRRRADTNQIHGARLPNVFSGGDLITQIKRPKYIGPSIWAGGIVVIGETRADVAFRSLRTRLNQARKSTGMCCMSRNADRGWQNSRPKLVNGEWHR